MLHDRLAAKALWAKISAQQSSDNQICLVTGEAGPVARLHPSIKNIWGAQSSGAAIVSFNLDAFTSYGHEQGDNAPVSEAAAFAYTTALNRFLERDSGHRIQIGDASTVFWAEAPTPQLAEEAEALVSEWFNPSLTNNETVAAKQIANKLEQIRKGVSLRKIEPDLEDVRFYVLGLSPNAARISIRFYFEDSFGALTKNYQRYLRDMAFEPWPQGRTLSVAASVLRTAPARIEKNQVKFDRDRISPLLSGELLRSILTGSRFPGSLLSLLLLRVRSDHFLDSVRIALIKGLIVRAKRLDGRLPNNPDGTPKEDYLVRTDPDDPNPARRLGRLFAVIERAQLAALGDDLNVTVTDKFLSAASATPRQVFSSLITNARNHHLKRLRNGHSDAKWIAESAKKSGQSVAKVARSVASALDADIGRLAGTFCEGFPAQHTVEQQGLFLVGYYQERYGRKKGDADGPDEDTSDVELNKEDEG
jgi:CRISPR-associated protein Csd1